MAVAVCCAASLPVAATPIRPDLKKLLSDPPTQRQQFAPARAGWSGPEAIPPSEQPPNPSMERFSPQASRRAVREQLRELLTPDWRAIGGIALVILLLRMLRARATKEEQTASQTLSDAMRPAA